MHSSNANEDRDADAGISSAFPFSEQVDVTAAVEAVKRFPIVFFGTVAAFLILATLLYYVIEPVYRSEVTLSPNKDTLLDDESLSEDMSFFRNIVSGGAGINDADRITQYLAILNSRVFVIPFLIEKSIVETLIGDKEGLTDEEKQIKAYERFIDKYLEIEQDRISGLIYLRVSWFDRESAATWSNELVSRLNAKVRSEYIAKAQRKIDYLDSIVDEATKTERKMLLLGLVEQEQRKVLIAKGETDFALEVLDPAIPSVKPDYPRLMFFLPIGLFVGAAIGMLLAVVIASRRGE